jgi:hypothetical protein
VVGGDRGEGRHGRAGPAACALVGERIGLVGDDALAQRQVLGAGLLQRNLGEGPDADLAFLAVDPVAVAPIGAAPPNTASNDFKRLADENGRLGRFLTPIAEPLVAMVTERDRPLADRRPDPEMDRLQTQPMWLFC